MEARKNLAEMLLGWLAARLAPLSDGWLLLAVAMGFALGAQGFGWGTYDCLNLDRMALKDVVSKNRPPLHPGTFYKPPLYTYLNHFLSRVPAQTLASNAFWIPQAERFDAYLKLRLGLARFWNLVLFAGCVAMVFWVAREFYGLAAGRMAALLFATSAGFIPYQVFLTSDMAVIFMMMAAFCCAAAISVNPSMGWSLAAGLLAGLAGATKYNGLAVAAALPVAHLAASRGNPLLQCLKRPSAWACGLAVPAGFLLGNPYCLLDWASFKADFLYNYKVTPVYGGETKANSYGDYFRSYAEIFGWPGLLLILAGAAVGLVVAIRLLRTSHAWKLSLLCLVVGGLYSWKIGSFSRMETRFVIPSAPYLLLFGAAGFGVMARWRLLAMPVLAAVLTYNLACGWWVGELFRKDPRNALLAFAAERIPPRSTLEVSASIPRLRDLPKKEFSIIKIPSGLDRWDNFSGRFAGDEDVMKVVAKRKEPLGLEWFSEAERARRNPGWIFWSTIDIEKSTRPFHEVLLGGQGGYRVVWDGSSPVPPPWAYPKNTEFLKNRATVWQKAQ